MLSVLRSLLAEIAPSLLKNRLQETSSDDKRRRDTLSVKRNPPPFGQRGAGTAAPKARRTKPR